MFLGCGAAIHWQASCGCAPLWPGLAQELDVPKNTTEQSMTPALVATHMRKRLEAGGRSGAFLNEVRSIGPFSEQVCAYYVSQTIRCTYWLWEHEGAHRGIQLDISESWEGYNPPELIVDGTYVFEKTGS